MGTCYQPHSGSSCEPALRAVGAARGRLGGGGASCLDVGRLGLGALPRPTAPTWACGRGHYPLAFAAGVVGVGSGPRPHSAQSCDLALRAVGEARGRPGGGGRRFLPGCGASRIGRSRTPDHPSLWRAAGARYPLAVGAVCGLAGRVFVRTFSRAAVRCVLFALPGFAAPHGRGCLAPVLVLWLWPAASLPGVPCSPALVRRATSSLVALGALVSSPVAVVPSPTPGAVARRFTGRLRGAQGGRLRTGLIVPAAGPCRGRGAGLAPRCTRLGPRDGVVPAGSLRLPSCAACTAVVWRVWTLSLTRPVSCTVPLLTGDSAMHRGCFVWTLTRFLLGRRMTRPGPARLCLYTLWGTGLISFTASNLQSTTPTPLITL